MPVRRAPHHHPKRISRIFFVISIGFVTGCASSSQVASTSSGGAEDGGSIDGAPDGATPGAPGNDGPRSMPTPATAKLSLWLDPSKGAEVEQGLLHWRDQSGNGNDVYDSDVSPWGYRGTVAGQPAVKCTACWLAATSQSPGRGFAPLTSSFLVLAVVNMDRVSPTEDGPFVHGFSIQARADVPPTLDSSLDGTELYANFVESPVKAAKIAGTHTLRLRRRAGSTLEVAVDGMASSTSSPQYSASITRVIFGTATRVTPDGNQRDADIHEILGWIGDVSDAEIDDLERYFRTKYQSSL